MPGMVSRGRDCTMTRRCRGTRDDRWTWANFKSLLPGSQQFCAMVASRLTASCNCKDRINDRSIVVVCALGLVECNSKRLHYLRTDQQQSPPHSLCKRFDLSALDLRSIGMSTWSHLLTILLILYDEILKLRSSARRSFLFSQLYQRPERRLQHFRLELPSQVPRSLSLPLPAFRSPR